MTEKKKKLTKAQEAQQRVADQARQTIEDLRKSGKSVPRDLWKEATGIGNIDILTPEEFFKKLDSPVESRVAKFFEDLKKKDGPRINPASKILLVNPGTNKWKWAKCGSREELKKLVNQSKDAIKMIESARHMKMVEYFKKADAIKSKKANKKTVREDVFGGFGFADDTDGSSQSLTGYQIKHEFTPLLGTPFFKQMYLYDYLLMHAKCFWYKNYSGPAKHIVGLIRNFVVGDGFSITCDDEKAKEAWEEYQDRSGIDDDLPTWSDELSFGGEHFIEKKFLPTGIVHASIDPSTIWEIVTDPENIKDVKYLHQQYPTQYQLYSAKDAPISEYILRQIPPALFHHTKVNVTTWEKRGRSDLLAALLYLKYFDDYIGFKLQRTKAEAAYFWDVVVKGDDDAVNAYISATQNTVDVPPGSENVHNEAIERKTIMPSLSHASSDDVAKWILSYIFMSESIPTSYAGTLESTGASRASALVATEPVTKMLEERRRKIEGILHNVWGDVMVGAQLDPDTEVEFNFPEIVVEDRSKKIADVIAAHHEEVISHETMSNIVAKELNHTTYDYDAEQAKIKKEIAERPDILDPEIAFAAKVAAGGKGAGDGKPGLTSPEDEGEIKADRSLDREKVRDQNTQL